MTQEELLNILENPQRKISIRELTQILYTLKNDAVGEMAKYNIPLETMRWYCGEINGFQIALDLIEHLEMENKK